jgi:hypothetical protein
MDMSESLKMLIIHYEWLGDRKEKINQEECWNKRMKLILGDRYQCDYRINEM